eukprot:9689182-Karenia_brevis.AAC.1
MTIQTFRTIPGQDRVESWDCAAPFSPTPRRVPETSPVRQAYVALEPGGVSCTDTPPGTLPGT